MTLASWLPRRMMARLTLVLIAALTIEFAGNLALNRLQEQEVVSEQRMARFAEQLVLFDQMSPRVHRRYRQALANDMTAAGLIFSWGPGTVITDATPAHPQLQRLKARLAAASPRIAEQDLRLSLIPADDGRRRDLVGSLRLIDGTFLVFRIQPFLGPAPSFALITLLHLLLVATVLGAALLMTWTFVRPLGELAEAADATGPGHKPDIPVRGPGEVQRVAVAFRAMQARLLQTMDDHTQALVAVSHDLRTPIQRIRLRSGFLEDDDAREGIARDLADMEKFVTSVADFIDSGLEEEARLIDLAALAMTLVDNVADTCPSIEYHGPDSLPAMVKAVTMKRALANLVENACAHAGRVRVVLDDTGPIVISVEDDGPGIPAELRERALQPFQRNLLPGGYDGVGSGIGLAIVKNAAAAMGAHLSLGESPIGGLAARIALPDAARTHATPVG